MCCASVGTGFVLGLICLSTHPAEHSHFHFWWHDACIDLKHPNTYRSDEQGMPNEAQGMSHSGFWNRLAFDSKEGTHEIVRTEGFLGYDVHVGLAMLSGEPFRPLVLPARY